MASNFIITGGTFSAAKFGNGITATGATSTAKVPAGTFSAEGWLKRSGNPGTIEVVLSQEGAFWVGVNTDGTLMASYGSGGPSVVMTSTAGVADNALHHYQIVVGSSGATLYCDGASVATSATSDTAAGVDRAAHGIALARFEQTGGFFFTGQVDEVAIWSTNRAGSVPTAAYVGNESGLQYLWHLDDASGADTAGGLPAATTYTLVGPTSGQVNVASSNFTVTATGSLSSAVTITPSAGAGGGTFTPSTVTLAAGVNSSATFTYTPATTGAKTISVTNNGGLTNPASIVYTSGAAGAGLISRNDAAVFYSPYAWDDNGTAKIANSNGSYVRFNFTGTSFTVNIVALTGLSVYPTFRAYIDNMPAVDITPTSGQAALAFATGLAPGAHSVRLVLKGTPLESRWDAGAGLKITGYQLDPSGSVSAYNPRSKRIVVYGDSITEGERVFSTAAPPTGSDGTKSIWPAVAEELDAEIGQLGYGAQGYQDGGVGGVPNFPSAWNLYNASGRSRLTGGLFSPAPDFVFEMHGTNGATTQANVAAMIANFRTAAPSATIFIVVPPGGFARAAKQAAVAAATTAGDTKVRLLDFGTGSYSDGLTSFALGATEQSSDGIHPYERTNMRLAAKMAAMIQHEAEPRRFNVVVG